MPKQVTPHGFVMADNGVLRRSGSDYKRTDGDDQITDLYYTLIQRNHQALDWDYRSQVIDAAIRLIGDNFAVFNLVQKDNPYLYGMNVGFYDDTVSFITYGHRKMSLRNWSALLSAEPAKDTAALKNPKREDKFIVVGDKARTTDVVSRWCSRDEGFDDMVRSLFLMFGRKR